MLAFKNEFLFTHTNITVLSGTDNDFKMDLLKNTATATLLFFKHTDLSLHYEYVLYKTSRLSGSSSNPFFDMTAQYRPPGGRYLLRLSGFNLLNRSAYLLSNTTLNFLSSTQYHIRPLTLLAEVSFRF